MEQEKTKKITITSSSGLSDEEIEKMVKDAELHAEEDKKLRESVDAKNTAESTINMAEKSMKDYGDKLTEDEKSKVNEAVSKLKETLAKADARTEDIKADTDALNQAAMVIGQKMYEAQQATQGATPNAESATNSGSVDDVEYEVKDE